MQRDCSAGEPALGAPEQTAPVFTLRPVPKYFCHHCGGDHRAGQCPTRPHRHSPGWRQRERRILERDGYRCRYCGDRATGVDHLQPLARGGTDDPDNLAACCPRCNRDKSDRTEHEYRAA